jgi:deoxyribonuclease V
MSRTSAVPAAWLHPASPAAARAVQKEMADHLLEEAPPEHVALVGGVDISTTRFDPEQRVHAAIVGLDWPGLSPVVRAGAVQRAAIPYIPGLLGFREVPAALEAWQRLPRRPELLLVDGHGRAHPRGLGIACHLGLVLDLPTIGVAKSILVGEVEGTLPDEPGAEAPLVWRGTRIGTALRTRRGANPLYISPGHRMTLAGAVNWVRRCGRGYRLPEPTRHAHLAAGALRRDALAEG